MTAERPRPEPDAEREDRQIEEIWKRDIEIERVQPEDRWPDPPPDDEGQSTND